EVPSSHLLEALIANSCGGFSVFSKCGGVYAEFVIRAADLMLCCSIGKCVNAPLLPARGRGYHRGVSRGRNAVAT
ncbi:hypothetical protein, partial [Enterobacter hormaechei]|uniref:hypothetical protein n=1 Tax=Enterobacter hormaechei TaxID=158836 RepID=UPI0020421749